MKYLSLCALVLASSVAVGAQQQPPPTGTMGTLAPAGTAVPGDDKIAPGPITLTGCVAAGTEKGSFMLTNVHRTDVAAATTGGTAVANPTSHTRYTDDNVVYWLDSPDKLEGHVGQSVRIEGVLEDDVDKSKVTTDEGKTTVTTERTKSVGVPEAGRAGMAASSGGGATRLTYKVTVKSITMLNERCAR
jgi:hypothetical protein